MANKNHAERRQERGVSLVEFALVMPVLALLTMGAFDLGWAVYANNSVGLAAREGARQAIIAANTDAQIKTAARNAAQGLNLAASDVVINPSQNGSLPFHNPGTTVSVTVNYTYHPITPILAPFIPGGSLVLSSRATMVVE